MGSGDDGVSQDSKGAAVPAMLESARKAPSVASAHRRSMQRRGDGRRSLGHFFLEHGCVGSCDELAITASASLTVSLS